MPSKWLSFALAAPLLLVPAGKASQAQILLASDVTKDTILAPTDNDDKTWLRLGPRRKFGELNEIPGFGTKEDNRNKAVCYKNEIGLADSEPITVTLRDDEYETKLLRIKIALREPTGLYTLDNVEESINVTLSPDGSKRFQVTYPDEINPTSSSGVYVITVFQKSPQSDVEMNILGKKSTITKMFTTPWPLETPSPELPLGEEGVRRLRAVHACGLF